MGSFGVSATDTPKLPNFIQSWFNPKGATMKIIEQYPFKFADAILIV